MNTTIVFAILTVMNVWILVRNISGRNIRLQNTLCLKKFEIYLERIFNKAKSTLQTKRGMCNNKLCTVQDSVLKQLVEKHGFDGLVFFVPMRRVHNMFGLFSYTSSSDEPDVVPCVIENDEMTTFEDGHKVRLRSIYPNYGTERMYVTDFESMLRSGTIKVFKDVDAVKEMSDLRKSYDSVDIVAVIRIPERALIDNALRRDSVLAPSDSIRELLFNCIVDDPKYLQNMLHNGTQIINVAGAKVSAIENVDGRVSHGETLERLHEVNTTLNALFPYDNSGERVIGSDLQAMRPEILRAIELSGDTYLRDDDDCNSDIEEAPPVDLDLTGKVIEALEGEGANGLIFALRAMGMFNPDIESILHLTPGRVSYILNKGVGTKPEYAWIYKLVEDQWAAKNWRARKYTEVDVDNFVRIAAFFDEKYDLCLKFDTELLSHRVASE